jgi:chromosome segregation protein
MRISRLRLTGFKSFVEPTELHIEPGLTGIVGPNGCGKSNLLEAIRWVMGESSPKSMRAGGMDDVIFAGTATRPAREFAEVTLVCDSEGAPLPGLVAEQDSGALEVVRRIERGTGSAYRANGQDVRARDVALIFADAATGAHSPALVSQGKVAGIINARPQERRQLLEEAAGIAGLHVRRKDAEQKLRATETNLARLADLLADMDARAGQLRRQARAAERYAHLSDQIRVAEARMIYARWREAAAAADAARSEAAAAEARVAGTQVAQERAARAQAEAVAAMASARDAATAAREAEHRLSTSLSEQRAERQALDRRLADIDAELARIARDRDAEDALAREGAAAIERLDAAAKAAAKAVADAEAGRPRLSADAALAADRLRDAEVTLAGVRAEAANEHAERRIAEAAASEARRRVERIEAEMARVARALAEAGDGAALEAAADAARADAESKAAVIGEAESAIASAGQARSAAAAALAEADAALAEARASLAALESELAALDRSLSASAKDARGVLAEMRVQPGYETALAAALGDDLGAPLLGAAEDGVRGWRVTDGTDGANDAAVPAGTVPLLSVVDAPPALRLRLSQIAVADQDSGQPLAPGQRLVTRDGRLRRWDGFISSGDGAAAAERLVRINRRESVAGQLPQVKAGLDQIEAARAAAAARQNEADATLASARRTQAAAEESARTARRAADAADAALERWRATAAHLGERQAGVASEAGDARAALAEAEAQLAALPDGTATAERLTQRQGEAEAARTALATVRDAIAALDRTIAREREAQVEAQAEARGWKARTGEAARRLSSMAAREEEIGGERTILAAKPAGMDARIAEAEQARDDANRHVAEALATERASADAARLAEAALDTAREALASARETRAGAVARAESAESRRIEMGRISGERFECPPPLLPGKAGFEADSVGAPQAESAGHERLSQERERIGPVNLVAAQELAELETEQATSAAEAEELTLAVNRLRGSIGHLNREGRQRLLAAFEQVDGHFRRLFETLFGGGQAHLALVESDDPLEAGLEIMAQPPGKKLASLTLLSGGEQALTAVALIFALFLTNPAPICVLDEVDAPLDDANVERFCDLLDRMTAETATRYLIVTHNAVTMARMHRLFGVTMVERGVSRLVSVDLGGAEQLLAAE